MSEEMRGMREGVDLDAVFGATNKEGERGMPLIECQHERGRNDDGTRKCKYMPAPCATKDPNECYRALDAVARAYQRRS